MVTVEQLALRDHLPQAVRLACMAWHEVEQPYRTGEFYAGTDVFLLWEDHGMLRYYALKDGDRIVGHLCFVVSKSRTTTGYEAFEETFFIEPEFRLGRNAVKLLKHALESLRGEGVGDIYIGSKLTAGRPIDALLKRYCGKHVANLYVF